MSHTPEQASQQHLKWLDRADACIAACAGMDDPAAEIAALKKYKSDFLKDLSDRNALAETRGNLKLESEREIAKLRADKQVLVDALKVCIRRNDSLGAREALDRVKEWE